MTAVVEKKSPIWIKHIESLVNKALELDEETRYALSQFDGKVIAFEFINTQMALFIFPSLQGVQIETEHDGKPDVWIKGTPGNFIKMLTASRDETVGLPADMQIMGDIGLAQRFQDIMQSIDIDLEEPLSKWVGDAAAYQLGKLFRKSGRYALNTTKTLAMDVSEYLRFETQMLPDDLLVEEFCNDVDHLRDDVDRFKQRVNRLEDRIKERGK